MADPLPLCYLNGAYLPLTEARISPLDRGFLYSDGVYEVMPVYDGRPFRFSAHAERLTRSLAAVAMEDPHSRDDWRAILGTLVERNAGGDQYLYWQVTRGAQYGRNARTTAGDHPDRVRILRAAAAARPRDARRRSGVRDRGRYALGALRHQVGGAARQRAAAGSSRSRPAPPRRFCCATASSPRPPPRRCTWSSAGSC